MSLQNKQKFTDASSNNSTPRTNISKTDIQQQMVMQMKQGEPKRKESE